MSILVFHELTLSVLCVCIGPFTWYWTTVLFFILVNMNIPINITAGKKLFQIVVLSTVWFYLFESHYFWCHHHANPVSAFHNLSMQNKHFLWIEQNRCGHNSHFFRCLHVSLHVLSCTITQAITHILSQFFYRPHGDTESTEKTCVHIK